MMRICPICGAEFVPKYGSERFCPDHRDVKTRSAYRRRQRKAEHRCVTCGRQDARTLAGKSYCEICVAYGREWTARVRAAREAFHCCSQCGAPLPDGWTLKTCQDCRDYHRELYYSRKVAGLCVACGKPLPEGWMVSLCDECGKRATEKTMKWKRKTHDGH